MVFNAVIINHTTPAVSVVVADSSGVTYNQIKQSLGNQVYDVQGFYLYSNNTSQLIGTIQYQRYDSTGHQDITSIATVVNPYQNVNSLIVDLEKTAIPIILNGQSSVATTILAQTYLQLKFLSKRLTNSFGMNLNNFRDMQRITNTEFFDNYGNSSIEEIQATNKALKNSISKKVEGSNVSSNIRSNTISPIAVGTTIAVASAGVYLIINHFFANGSK